MGKHILQLKFPDSSNQGVFLIDDISIYDGGTGNYLTGPYINMASGTLHNSTGASAPSTPSGTTTTPVNCPNLQITPPGFYTPTSLDVQAGFHLVLNACILGISPVNSCGTTCPDLDDGIWNVRYSVAPNDKVFVEYKILRIVGALRRYHHLLCNIGISPCLPDREVQYELDQLDMIFDYLIAAKVMVENEHQYEDGVNMYRFAVECMDKMSLHPKRC